MPRLKARVGAKRVSCAGRSSEAHIAGVRISATNSDSTMAEMMVTENWR